MLGGRRVVVTGVGLVTPLGVGAPHVWSRLTNGDTATTQVADDWAKKLPSRVVARIPCGIEPHEMNLQTEFSSSELRTLSPASAVALIAAKEAVADASWTPTDTEECQATGVGVGMAMSDLEDILASGKALDTRYSRVNPFFIPRILTNMASGQISMKYGFQGPNHSVATACATGTHAIGDSFRMIKYGDADVMICGGTEAGIGYLAMAGFCRLRALSVDFNDRPSEASRPFDRDRDGFVMGEGAGILVLEELSHAIGRRAKIYAEILGYGTSGDAHHITAPHKGGVGAHRAMVKAIKEAGVDVTDVGYVNAHATSTPLGDAIELAAIERLFGSHSVQVSSTKGAIGHLLGAAGAVESVFTTLACHSASIPPTANLHNTDGPTTVDLVAGTAKPWLLNAGNSTKEGRRRVAIKNSFGFGGTNACLCLASYDG